MWTSAVTAATGHLGNVLAVSVPFRVSHQKAADELGFVPRAAAAQR